MIVFNNNFEDNNYNCFNKNYDKFLETIFWFNSLEQNRNILTECSQSSSKL